MTVSERDNIAVNSFARLKLLRKLMIKYCRVHCVARCFVGLQRQHVEHSIVLLHKKGADDDIADV